MVDVYELLYLFFDDVEAIHRYLNLWETDLNFLQFLGLILKFILHLLEIIQFHRHFGSLDFLIGLSDGMLAQLIYRLLDCLLVEVDETNVLFEVFKLLINSGLLHSKAVVVLEFDLCSLSLNLVYQFLVVRVYLLDVFDSADFHLFIQIITLSYQIVSLIR